MIKLSPSLLAADICSLHTEMDKLISAGADELHFDVMDGHFVPNLTFGPHILSALKKKYPEVKYDVHLMVSNPLNFIVSFAEAGADVLTVHAECDGWTDALLAIRKVGLEAGVSIKPGTPPDVLFGHFQDMDRILLMTVEPGFGGQKLMPEVLSKASVLREAGFRGEIEADGGINVQNMHQVIDAGVTILVMGTGFFRSEDPYKTAKAVHCFGQ